MKRVSAALIEQRGEFLIARRSAQDTLGGFWEFPGGKVEKGETPQECLEREILEELVLNQLLVMRSVRAIMNMNTARLRSSQ